MDSEDEIIRLHVRLIIDFLHGLYSEDEFIAEVKRLPKLTTALPQPTGLEGANLWD